MEQIELQRAIEAILFAAGERIEVSRLSAVLEVDPDEVTAAAVCTTSTYSGSAAPDTAK